VLGSGIELALMGRLLAGLPNLTCLQLEVDAPPAPNGSNKRGKKPKLLDNLPQAPPLQQLYFTGPPFVMGLAGNWAQWLPDTLQRLSWRCASKYKCYTSAMSRLRQLKFMQSDGWRLSDRFCRQHLPAGLQELELVNTYSYFIQLIDQLDRLTAYSPAHGHRDGGLPRLVTCPCRNVKAVPHILAVNVGPTTLQQLTALSSLGVGGSRQFLQPVMEAASSCSSLCRLQLRLNSLEEPLQLAPLTQVTHLAVSCSSCGDQQQQGPWAAEVGRMSWLRWLSVPGVVLVAGQAWLGGMEQLQVLMVSCEEDSCGHARPLQVLPRVLECLEGCEALPPRLLLLGVAGMTPEQAASWQVRRRLQRRLSSSGSGCEVVVGVDLNEVCEPMVQLAGLPEGLQQALA
jgi:hypothetical protein